jgi:hypothetical protein
VIASVFVWQSESHGQAQPKKPTAQEQQSQAPKGAPPVTLNLTVNPTIEKAPCDEECQRAEQRKNTREEDGLKTQISATDAAWEAIKVNWFQAVVGAVTLIFVGATFYQTKRTADAAIAAAKATEAAVAVARQTEKRQLRAYVGVEKVKIESPSTLGSYEPTPEGEDGRIFKDFIAVTIKNFGNTPARQVEVLAGIAPVALFAKAPTSEAMDAAISKSGNPSSFIARAHLQTQQSEIIKCKLSDLNAVLLARQDQQTIYVFGRIFYQDAYDDFWSTKFCYAWEPSHPGGERFVSYQDFNGEDRQKSPNA